MMAASAFCRTTPGAFSAAFRPARTSSPASRSSRRARSCIRCVPSMSRATRSRSRPMAGTPLVSASVPFRSAKRWWPASSPIISCAIARSAPASDVPQPDHISALPVADPETLDEDLRALFVLCVEKLGIVPNVLRAYGLRPQKLRNFVAMYNELMLAPSGLTKLEREMVAVVVSSANRCYYCLVAHGQAVRRLSGDPDLGEMLVMNYRVAPLDTRRRAMLDFAWKLAMAPATIGGEDREGLHRAGLGDEDSFDLAATAAFFNMSNRMASGLDIIPNHEYHRWDR